MSSATANRESEGGTMRNVIDNPETQPQSHKYAENQSQSNMNQGNNDQSRSNMNQRNNDQSRSNMNQGNKAPASTYANQESPGGTMKNVIDNPATKPQSQSNMGQGNNKCSANGPDHQPGENSCNNCRKK
jgi:hypothetical protein